MSIVYAILINLQNKPSCREAQPAAMDEFLKGKGWTCKDWKVLGHRGPNLQVVLTLAPEEAANVDIDSQESQQQPQVTEDAVGN